MMNADANDVCLTAHWANIAKGNLAICANFFRWIQKIRGFSMFFIEKSMEKAVGIWYSNTIEGQALPISKYTRSSEVQHEQESIPVLQDLGVPFGTGDAFHFCWMPRDTYNSCRH